VSTIFGLLFWDVYVVLLCRGTRLTPLPSLRIFASVPGAFETPYQSAPLDIFEDTFYSARRELIDQRLTALKRGEAHVLLEQVITRERVHRTSCIGVDWDFQPVDLLDIVDVSTSSLLHVSKHRILFEVSRRSCTSNHLSNDM
jgi:fanconi-associated nuclease 1